jgi:sugar diacid utilization regulator
LYMDLINGKESPKKINSRNCLISITLTSYRNSILIQLSSRKKTNLLEYLQNIDYRIEFLPRLHGLSIVKQSTIQIDWEE